MKGEIHVTYNKLKLSVYESYSNNELTFEAANHLINKIDDMYADSLVNEMTAVENEFINTSLSVVTESAGMEVLTEAAKSFGEKVKALWAKFKAWVKTIIDKILGRKKQAEGTKVVAHPKLKGAMDNMSKAISKLKSVRTVADVAAALAAVAAATVGIKKYNKLKVQNENLDAKLQGAQDDYAKLCDQNKDLIQSLQEATDKASKYLEDVQALNKEFDVKDASIRALEKAIDEKKKDLEKEKSKTRSLTGEVNNAYKMLDASNKQNSEKSDKIDQLTKEIADLQKKMDDAKAAAKERESNLSSERDAANAKIKQMTPSYLMGIATQATRALEATTAIALPQKSTKTIDDEAKAKQIAEAKKKQEAEDLEKYKQAAMKKYEAAKAEQQAKLNEEAKKKIPDIKAKIKQAEDKLRHFKSGKVEIGLYKYFELGLTSTWPTEIDKARKSGDFYLEYRYSTYYLDQLERDIKDVEEEIERVEHPERFGRRRMM